MELEKRQMMRMKLDIWTRDGTGIRNRNKDRKEVGDRLKTSEEMEIGWDGAESSQMGYSGATDRQ